MGAFARMIKNSANWMTMDSQVWKALRNALRFATPLVLVCFALLALNACGGGGASGITIEIQPKAAQNLDQNQAVNFVATLANDTNNRGVKWTVTGSSCSGNGCGVLSNVTTTSVTYTAPAGFSTALVATLTATAVANTSITSTVTINVALPLTITTATVTNGMNGTPYSQTLVSTGGVSPIVFSLANNSAPLPAGLTLNSTGSIVGIPSGSNVSSTFSVIATDYNTISSPPVSFTIFIQPAPTLSISTPGLPPGTKNVPYSFRLAALGGITPLRWNLSGTLPPGLTFNKSSGTISGIPSQTGTFASLAFSVQDSSLPAPGQTATATFSLSIQAPAPLQFSTLSLPQGTTGSSYSAPIQATGGVPPYTWSVISGQLPPGLTFSSSTSSNDQPNPAQISGIPTLETSSTPFTVQVQDSEVNPANGQPMPATTTQNFLLSVNQGTSSQALFTGSYAFLFQGYDADGAVVMAGGLTANGSAGTITAGTLDSNRVSGVFINSALTGTFTLGTDGRGTMQLIATNARNQTFTADYLLALNSDGSIQFIENQTLDTTGTHGSGILKPQTPGVTFAASNFSGNYAFGFSGQDLNKMPVALAGVIHSDGNSLLSPGTADINDAGVYDPQLNLTGTYSIPTVGFGRGGAQFVYKLPSAHQITADYSFFFVSNTDAFFMATDTTDATHPRAAGEMVAQEPNAQFSAASLSGNSVVTGTGASTNSTVFAGLLSPGTAPNTLNLLYDENNGSGAAIQNPPVPNTFTGGAYTVNTNGRANFSGLGPRLAAAYLTGPNQGFLIGSDTAVTSGLLENQTATLSLGPAMFQGNYAVGSAPPADPSVSNFTGQVVSTGTNVPANLTGTADITPGTGTVQVAQQLVGSYTIDATTGRGILTTNSAGGFFPVTLAFYVVSPGSVRLIPLDANFTHPGVIFFDH